MSKGTGCIMAYDSWGRQFTCMGIINSKAITQIYDHFNISKIHLYVVTLQLGSYNLATVTQTFKTFHEFF